MSVIDVRTKKSFTIESTLLVPEDLFPPCEVKGDYLETFSITPIIIIEGIKIRNNKDIFKIATKKQIYKQKFVLARIYLYVDDTENNISFYFDGFPFSYQLEDINKEIIRNIDDIFDEEQYLDCIEDDYKQILDQLSRMIDILLNAGHSLKAFMRWAAIEELNPQNKIQ